MNNFKIYLIAVFVFSLFACEENSKLSSEPKINKAEVEIRQIHKDYVTGWKAMNEQKVMGLLVVESQIQPNSLKPIIGKENIRNFWFPKDSSKTIINQFTTEILSIKILDTLAISTHSSILDWDYQKGASKFGMFQKGINTTIYKKQSDQSWKIWRSMWTDLLVKQK